MRLIVILSLFLSTLFSTALDDKLNFIIINQPQKLSLYEDEQKIIQKLYKSNNNLPLWIGHANNLNSLIAILQNPYFNYKYKDFHQSQIEQYIYLLHDNMNLNMHSEELSQLDILLTRAYVKLVKFIVQGDINWDMVQMKIKGLKEAKDISADWEMVRKNLPSTSDLFRAIANQDIKGFLNSLIPSKKEYSELIEALSFYRNLNNLEAIKYEKDLRPGDEHPYIMSLKKRLILSGDLNNKYNTTNIFDEELKYAIFSYKDRFKLEQNGLIDKILIYYLNKPIHLLSEKIMVNLDKLKVFPNHFPNEYIRVNIPDFKMNYYKNGQSILEMRAVVGKPERPTPLFSSYMTYIELNPNWNIPENLVRRDLIIALQENPNYLKEHNIHVFYGWKSKGEMKDFVPSMLFPYADESKGHIPYRFVQYPGDDNALGRIKFMFPNKYAVYLHDTDNKSLFQYRYRVYSSGCMRLEKPFELLEVLKSRISSRDLTQIEKYRNTLTNKVINFTKKLPVHTTYFTVFKRNGLTYFRKDIYEYDKFIKESELKNF
ncbi:MAG: Peptidoglycan-binding domain 1 [uncultured Sulfurovum sp.]|uniref:Peptidoglycan-binding domain 1 n=1 Tax=uncultured Sulfurovum sp. TaxID=269237 RepID=A0A6S6T4Z5_9BACT|nr:MAG: Peptidoglycan-binding domain 1 [uncultured Sulfurovum sp.]